MKTIDLFNLYIDESRPDVPWSEYKIGSLTVRLTDDYNDKVSLLPQPPMWTLNETGLQRSPAQKGTWQATATVSWKGAGEKSILLDKVADDGGLWDLCNLLTFMTGRIVVTEKYQERYRPDIYGDCYAVVPIETLPAAALAWQNRECLVSKNLHIALHLYNEAMNANLLQSRAALYCTALNIILDQHEMVYEKVSKPIRKKLKNEISDLLTKKTELQPDHEERYKNLLHGQIDRGPSLLEKLFSLLQSLEIIDPSPTPEQKTRVQYVDRVRNVLMHTGRIPELKGLDDEQAERYTVNIAANVVPELIRIVIGHHLGFRADDFGVYCQIKDDTINFFQNGVFREHRFAEICEQVLKKNSELYQRLS
ncbi:MAG: hypothetical protein F4Y39_23820 [Gemmatimonadetes bacterium]|nr:hypothetical protein [Gemmatimonadota bacterium]MYF74066.1 hypothetical protein [Gemmatimonadota bacterium]MYK54249.1 hypothetical protein [Gemmatimonadota bacterium]